MSERCRYCGEVYSTEVHLDGVKHQCPDGGAYMRAELDTERRKKEVARVEAEEKGRAHLSPEVTAALAGLVVPGAALSPFGEFCRAVGIIVGGMAKDKGYRGGDDPRPGGELYTFIQNFFGEGHPLGEIVYKAVRFQAKGQPEDLVKIAAWAYLVWARGEGKGSSTVPADLRPEPETRGAAQGGSGEAATRLTFEGFQRDAVSSIRFSPQRERRAAEEIVKGFFTGITAKEWADRLEEIITRHTGGPAVYHAIGVAEEAGEVMGKVKKALRNYLPLNDPEVRRAVIIEIGDVLWYLAAMCHDLGYNLEEAAKENIEKRRRRTVAGTIKGEGDNR